MSTIVAWLYEAEGFADAFSKTRLPMDRLLGNPKETALYSAPVSATDGDRRLAAAEALCALYFQIAADAIGEDRVRAIRDAAIARVNSGSSAS